LAEVAHSLLIYRVGCAREQFVQSPVLVFIVSVGLVPRPNLHERDVVGLDLCPLQPRFLPEGQAPRLAAIVAATIAAELLEVNGSMHPPREILLDGVTRFVGPLGNAELPSAVLEHLRHKRQGVELASLIESCQDFGGAADFDKFARAEIQALLTDAARFPGMVCRR
jgi:hypothetical protein